MDLQKIHDVKKCPPSFAKLIGDCWAQRTNERPDASPEQIEEKAELIASNVQAALERRKLSQIDVIASNADANDGMANVPRVLIELPKLQIK